MHKVFRSLSPYQHQSITYQMLPWISAVEDAAGAAEQVALGRGELPSRRALGPQGAAISRRMKTLAIGSPGRWVQQLPLAPAEHRATLRLPSTQPPSAQADLLLVWSCWSQVLQYSHPYSLPTPR